METGQATTRAMVSNFDSVAQQSAWQAIMQTVPARHRLVQEDMWATGHAGSACMQLLNRHGGFARRFAGIIRTAYLYSTNIVLPYSQVLDGVFFLALGPDAIRQIMGQTFKDAPAIILSGRGEDLLTSMARFFLCRMHVADGEVVMDVEGNGSPVRRGEGGLKGRRLPVVDDPGAPAEGEDGDEVLYGIRPLIYSALGMEVTPDDVLSLPLAWHRGFTQRVRSFRDAPDVLPSAIGDAFARVRDGRLHGEADAGYSPFGFLSQRLAEWVRAEAQGLVRYEDQDSHAFRRMRDGSGKAESLGQVAGRYLADLEAALGRFAVTDGNGVPVRLPNAELHTLCSMTNRSAAFMFIDGEVPDTAIRLEPVSWRHRGDAPLELTMRSLIHDWYQSAYMRWLAMLVGAELVSVSMAANSFETIVLDCERRQGRSLVLDGGITESLGEVPYTSFATFCYEYRQPIGAWRTCTTHTARGDQRRRTRDVAYAVQSLTEGKGYRSDLAGMWGRFAVMVVVAVISVTMDNFLESQTMGFVALFACLMLVELLPDIIDMVRFATATRTQTRTIVHMG